MLPNFHDSTSNEIISDIGILESDDNVDELLLYGEHSLPLDQPNKRMRTTLDTTIKSSGQLPLLHLNSSGTQPADYWPSEGVSVTPLISLDPGTKAFYCSSSKSSVDDHSSDSYSPPDSDDEPTTENHVAYDQEHLLTAAECGDVKIIKVLLSDASTIDINYKDKKVSLSVVFR